MYKKYFQAVDLKKSEDPMSLKKKVRSKEFSVATEILKGAHFKRRKGI